MRLDWRGFVLPALLIAAAEIGARLSGPSDSVAPPSTVALAFIEALGDGSLLASTRDTLVCAFAGLAIGGTVGLTLGVVLGAFRALDQLMEATIELVRPIPSVALVPVALVALGFGYRLEMAIVAFACTWPVLLLTRAAVGGVEPRLIEVARALRLSFPARVVKIIVPAALPRIFVAFRLATGIALTVAVTVEVSTNPLGLGYGIMLAGQSLHPDLMLAYLVWIGVIGWSLNVAITAAQQRLFGRSAQIRPAQ